MHKVAIAAVLLSLSPISHATCEGLPERVNKELGYPDMETKNYLPACKIWLADTSKTLVALARHQKGPNYGVEKELRDGLYDLDVVVAKADSGEILHRLFQKGTFMSDAIRLEGIEIDTARYQLAPNVVAFGVRDNRGGPAEVQTLGLFVIQQNKLKQVLDNMNTVARFHENHTDCPHSSDVKRTLAIANTASRGYADLVAQEKTIIGEPIRTKDDCSVKETQSSLRYTLRFDGNTYVLPPELRNQY